MSGKLLMSIGIPGSGKTTFLKQLDEFSTADYVCPDDIRAELAGDASDQSQNEMVWVEARKRISKALAEGKTVILDATQTEPSYRKQYIELGKVHDAEVIGYHFDTPLQVALKRNQTRTRTVPETVIIDMHSQLQETPPTKAEGFTDLQVV